MQEDESYDRRLMWFAQVSNVAKTEYVIKQYNVIIETLFLCNRNTLWRHEKLAQSTYRLQERFTHALPSHRYYIRVSSKARNYQCEEQIIGVFNNDEQFRNKSKQRLQTQGRKEDGGQQLYAQIHFEKERSENEQTN